MAETLTDHLQRVYHIAGFRSLQEEIVLSVLNGEHVAAFLPTGMGKTLLYQVPTTFLKLKTVVISPLIALIRDQAERARKLKIPVFELHGLQSNEENKITLDLFFKAETGLLILSPERWNLQVRDQIEKREQSIFLVIDEAHCISVWGQSFRPSYTEMKYDFVSHSESRLLVLSATPTPDLIKLVNDQFQPGKLRIFTGDLYRYNLSYAVRIVPSALDFLSEVTGKLKGASVLYHQSRDGVEKLAELFASKRQVVSWFHAGLEKSEKQKQSASFLSGKSDFMVATSAFGMGIDKPDIRYIFHFDIPETIEEYLQETGRAGRDGKKSWIYLIMEQEQVHWLKKGIEEIENWLNSEPGEFLSKPDFRSPYARKQFSSVLQTHYPLLVAESEFSEIPFYLKVRIESHVSTTSEHGQGELTIPDLLVHLYTGKIAVDFVTIDLVKLSDSLNITRTELFHRLLNLVSSGILVLNEQKNQLPFTLPAKWNSPEKSPGLLKSIIRQKLEKLRFWLLYLTGNTCLMNSLVTELGAGKKGYSCGQCSPCLEKSEGSSSLGDMDLITTYLRNNNNRMTYRDLLVQLSGVWYDEKSSILSKNRIDQVITFGLKEGWFREIRKGNGSEIELIW
ncbi:MAG: RecQ family ATP-dependent DNA helicase [Bacteroidetes bacterium]|nr:RecQ family ATP-dependent DNA helicase [Bacteroidota bacterium]